MPLFLSEDAALKDRLTGMTVSDGNSANRGVGVWFGQPDREIRAQDFPFVIINLIDISEARERVMNENPVFLPYLTPPEVLADNQEALYNRPIPINIDYNVSAFSRHPRHDRQLLNQLFVRLPQRGGMLGVTHDKEDEGTARRLDFLGYSKRDRIEDNKRLFINDFTIRVSSEMYPEVYKTLTYDENALNWEITGDAYSLFEVTDTGTVRYVN